VITTLILTVGLPRSGKSTWALSTGFPIVCPDAIRLALHGQRFIPEAEPMVWATAQYMVRALFLAGHARVVFDATNLRAESRKEWDSPRWKTAVRIFPTDATTCIQRALDTGQADLLPVIDRMNHNANLFENFQELQTRTRWE
jgi:predicted kinase